MVEQSQTEVTIAPIIITPDGSEENAKTAGIASENLQSASERIEGELAVNAEREHIDSDAVAIAAIRADADITIVAINADVEKERIAAAENTSEKIAEITSEQNERTIEECRQELALLREQVTTLENLITPLIPPLSQESQTEETAMEIAEELTEQSLETAQEPSSILTDTPTPIAEIKTEVSVENEEGDQVTAEVKIDRKYIAI